MKLVFLSAFVGLSLVLCPPARSLYVRQAPLQDYRHAPLLGRRSAASPNHPLNLPTTITSYKEAQEDYQTAVIRANSYDRPDRGNYDVGQLIHLFELVKPLERLAQR